MAYESTYKKKHDIFVRFEKDYFSKQILDIHRGAAKKSSLQFHCELERIIFCFFSITFTQDLTQINKLTRGLDFFQEPIRETALNPETNQPMLIEYTNTSIQEVSQMAEFLDRMGTLDIVETTILKNKLEPDWDYVGQLYGEENKQSRQNATDGQVVSIIPLKRDDVISF